MTQTVELLLDLAAPNGYLAWYPLKDITARTNSDLIVTPVFLGGMHRLTGNAPPMLRDAQIKGKVEYAALEFRRFLERHDLNSFRMHPDLPFNSILLQRILAAARTQEEMHSLVNVLQPAVWERNIDCSNAESVRGVLSDAGLEADYLIDAASTDSIKSKLVQNTQHAVDRGAFGIPTFFVGPEMWFGKERLEQIERYLVGDQP